MEKFEYVARDRRGNQRVGLRQSGTEHDVLAWLREHDLIPVSVQPIGVAEAKKAQGKRKRIKSEEMGTFCWQLTTMVEGGVAITDAIDTITDDIDNATLRETLAEVSARMKTGESFSDSIGQFPKVFNSLFCAMILAGEASGTLAPVLQRLAAHYESRDKHVRKLRAALSYPVFVLGFIILMVAIIMVVVVPKFKSIFAMIQGELPAFTQAFMNFHEVLMAHSLYILPLMGIATAAVIAYHKTEQGHEKISKIVLAIPLVGNLVAEAFVSMFCLSMSTLLSAGVSIVDTLDILSRMTKNDVIRQAILRTRDHIVAGSNISLSMIASEFFPGMVSKMVQVGEESGSLPTVLDRTGHYYAKRVDAAISTLTSLLQPIMIISVGAIVLVIIIALYLPVFSISG